MAVFQLPVQMYCCHLLGYGLVFLLTVAKFPLPSLMFQTEPKEMYAYLSLPELVVGNAAHPVGKQHSFWFQKPGVLLDEGKRSTFVIDGAWHEASFRGAAAWVQNGKDRESTFQVQLFNATSATLVEIKAGIMVLEWAISHGIAEVRINMWGVNSTQIISFFC
ncbi:hypothetical protein RHMOL_Rhmol03G0119800 [Rhododendron molle]|uniref:Uncharacterized protein n=1 Tax=Rhododendron molle TaxID=49168 RepID=A0ACC0PCZ6_RHOML|nr:hypothetical protein RHMOL_Rhmol03G0119800 [Rhododendron molle]